MNVVLAACLAISAGLAVEFLNSYQNWGDDWAQYILQAKAILAGNVDGYVAQNSFMLRESSMKVGPVAYPWGLPMLLAIEGALFSFDLHVFKAVNIAIFLLLVVATFWLARGVLSDRRALAAACMMGFNPDLLHYCNDVLTEIPFTFITVCSFIVMDKAGVGGRQRALLWPVGTGALAFAAFAFRTNGILILTAAIVKAWSTSVKSGGDSRRTLASALAVATFLLLSAVWQVLLPAGGESHLQFLGTLSIGQVASNLGMYPVSLFDFFTGGMGSVWAALLLGPLVVLGAVRSWRSTAHISVYVLLTLALYCVWPATQGYRFMIPLTPLMVIFLSKGIEAVPPWHRAGRLRDVLTGAIQYGVPAVFLGVAGALVGSGRVSQEIWNPYDRPSSEMFTWIGKNTPTNAVTSFFKPRVMHLIGKRLSITEQLADVTKVSFLVYTKQVVRNEGQPTIEEYQQTVSLIWCFENENFVVYRVEPK